MGSRGVWGIDVGQNALKAVRLEWIDRIPTLTAFESIAYRRILPENHAERVGLVRQALDELVRKHSIRGERAVVAIPGNIAFTKPIKLPPIADRRQIASMIKYEARQQIPQIDDVRWDYHLFPADAGGEVEAVLFAVKKALLSEILTLFQGSPFVIEAVQLAPVALYNFARFENPAPDAFVLIDFGSENSDFVSVAGPRFWVRNIRIAGRTITSSLQEKLKLTFEEAENLKCKAGQSAQSDRIFAIMVPILRELLSEVQRSIGFFKSQHRDVQFDEILVMGNSLKLEGFEHFLRTNLQYRVRKLSALKRIACVEDIDPARLKDHLLSLGVALGLALQGLGECATSVNLAPEEMLKKGRLRRLRPVAVAAAAALWLFVGVDHLVYRARAGALDRVVAEHAHVQSHHATLRKNFTRFAEARDQADKMAKTFDALLAASDRESPERSLEILENLANCSIFRGAQEPLYRVKRLDIAWTDGLVSPPGVIPEGDPMFDLGREDGELPPHIAVRMQVDVKDPEWAKAVTPSQKNERRKIYVRLIKNLSQQLQENSLTLSLPPERSELRVRVGSERPNASPPEYELLWRVAPGGARREARP